MFISHSIDALTDATLLSQVLGHGVERVRVEPLGGVGYSNASLTRVEVAIVNGERRSFVLKRTRLASDWTASRTADRHGREAQLLNESRLQGVWDAFVCPYVACAAKDGEVGLLMTDLTSGLLPDVRVPLSDAEEQSLLGALARLHARFWDAGVSSIEWLVRPGQYCNLLGPCVAGDPVAIAALSPALRDSVPRGWASALARLPKGVARHVTCPGKEWEDQWSGVPSTLVHGDVKVANFALLSGGGVAAFDWAVAGAGPCTIDVGWYLAVNASRLTASKEAILGRYRTLLETARGSRLSDSLWQRLEDIAIVCGARMLLWSKALALDAGRAGSLEEWNWWTDRLARLSVRSV